MRVGFPFNGDQIGGSSFSSIALLHGLRSLGIDTRVILHGDGAMTDEIARQGNAVLGGEIIRLRKIGVHAVDSRPHRFQMANYLAGAECYRTIKRHGIDIVHLNDLAMVRTWSLPARLSGARSLIHWRSNYRPSWSVDLGLRACSRIVAIARYNRDQLPVWARRKAVIEYNPCAPAYSEAERIAARQRIRHDLGVDDNARLIGIFGAHIKRKRTHVLADILNALRSTRSGQPIMGIACGKRAEPYDDELDRKIADFGLAERLLKPGFVRPAEDWMAACDILIAPAEKEPFGRTVIEGARVGVPVIMSSDSGASELIQDGLNGRLVGPFDLDGWIAAVRELLDRPDLAAGMAVQAARMIEELHPSNHAARIVNIYRAVMPEGTAP